MKRLSLVENDFILVFVEKDFIAKCRIIDDFIKEFLNSNRGGNIRKQAEAEELARKVESLNAESVSL
ncbi:Common plant regulatory factor [Trifolium repens]|nr:Common plant regulatory factor [Trifolium repens]